MAHKLVTVWVWATVILLPPLTAVFEASASAKRLGVGALGKLDSEPSDPDGIVGWR